MDDIHSVGATIIGQRAETRASLASTLTEIAQGRPPAVAPAAVADLLDRDHRGVEGDAAWALGQALRALDMAITWEPAVGSADANPSRFRDASRHIAGKALAIESLGPLSRTLRDALVVLARLDQHDEVKQAAALLARTPVPAGVTNLLKPRSRWTRPVKTPETPPPPTVLLRFNLEGEPVSWPMALNPARAYRLEAVASVEHWPDAAKHMSVELQSEVPPSVIERPTIIIKRGNQKGEGFLVPRAEIGPGDSVLLTPVVTFIDPDDTHHPAKVVGQRTLRVTTFDPINVGSGQPMVTQRIVELLAELDARIPNLPRQDRRNLIHLLEATARFSALANERTDLRGLDEREFQAKLKQAFVQDRFIGTRIQEAPKLGAGTTDLYLERIVDELKVSHDPLDIDEADKFVRQPTQYASAGDCPISVLTVLEDSPKSDPPGIASNYMRWVFPKLHGAANPNVRSMVAVVIVPIAFPVPSHWSTLKAGEVEHGE